MPTETPAPVAMIPTPTSPPLGSPTPIGAPTTTAFFPVTGNSPTQIIEAQDDWICQNRLLTVDLGEVPENTFNDIPVRLVLSSAGDGHIAYNMELLIADFPVDIQLVDSNPTGNQAYLLQVIDPKGVLLFNASIIQYLSNCTRNNTKASISLLGANSDAIVYPELRLVTWGASFDGQAWLARLSIPQDGIYWLEDSNGDFSFLDGDFYVEAPYCSPASLQLVDTTGGIRNNIELFIFSPMSFCENEEDGSSSETCTDPGSRLLVGGKAQVAFTDGSTMRIRELPGFDQVIITTVPEGTNLEIVDGPKCVDGSNWWSIRTDNGDEGWMTEWQGETYLLEPVD